MCLLNIFLKILTALRVCNITTFMSCVPNIGVLSHTGTLIVNVIFDIQSKRRDTVIRGILLIKRQSIEDYLKYKWSSLKG